MLYERQPMLFAYRGWFMWIVLLLVLTTSTCSVLAWIQEPLVVEENAILERAQAALLLLGCTMFGIRAFGLRSSPVVFIAHAGLGLLALSFALRELDIDRIGESSMSAHIEHYLRLFALILWIALFALAIRHLRTLLTALPALLKMPTMVLAIIGGLFLVAGWPFDKALVLRESPQLSLIIEETLELNGYMMLMASSVVHLFAKDRKIPHVGPSLLRTKHS